MKRNLIICALLLTASLTACAAPEIGTATSMNAAVLSAASDQACTLPVEKPVISADEAKAAALAHAGLSEASVTYARAECEWDDGRQVYEIEFYTSDYKEYDYELDAYTGEVLSFDADAEHYAPPAAEPAAELPEAEARQIALAKVPGAEDKHIRTFRKDYDDGRTEYEGEIYYKAVEYEFEIDARTGEILSWEAETIFD